MVIKFLFTFIPTFLHVKCHLMKYSIHTALYPFHNNQYTVFLILSVCDKEGEKGNLQCNPHWPWTRDAFGLDYFPSAYLASMHHLVWIQFYFLGFFYIYFIILCDFELYLNVLCAPHVCLLEVRKGCWST